MLFDEQSLAEYVYRQNGECRDWDMVDMWTTYFMEVIPEEQDEVKRAKMNR